MTIAELLRRAEVGPSFLKDLRKNPGQNPRLDTLGRIAAVLTLPITHFQEPIHSPPLRVKGVEATKAPAPKSEGQFDQVQVAEYDVHLSAGPGAIVTEEYARRHWFLPRSFLESMNLAPEQIAFVEIIGDSMYPTLWPGDLVLLDLRSKNPAQPAIYAVWDSDATVCKRVERVPRSDPPMLRLISDNPAYSQYEVPAEWANVIGRVAWFARRI